MRRILLAIAVALFGAGTASASDGIVSEVRAGVLAHDLGIFGNAKEGGASVNAEVYFKDLKWIDGKWQFRPSVGVTVNTQGDTSFAYANLNVSHPISEAVFVEAGAGVAVHNGEKRSSDPETKELGSQVLFHLSASVGVELSERVTLSAYVDHISNGNLAHPNEGLETVGIRLGVKF